MPDVIQFTFQILILIFSVIVHEVSHGYAALALGDRTAQFAGRLTLNPVKHIDPFGSIILPAFSYLLGGVIFGWAKPVPYNPYNLQNQKWGPAIVGFAGPAANIALALIFGLLIRFLPETVGSLGGPFLLSFISIASVIVLLNLVLAIFNLIPIPPLDGSRVLFALLPYRFRNIENFLEQYGIYAILLFIFLFSRWLFPIAIFFYHLITGISPFF